jgi:hypothetical protein
MMINVVVVKISRGDIFCLRLALMRYYRREKRWVVKFVSIMSEELHIRFLGLRLVSVMQCQRETWFWNGLPSTSRRLSMVIPWSFDSTQSYITSERHVSRIARL